MNSRSRVVGAWVLTSGLCRWSAWPAEPRYSVVPIPAPSIAGARYPGAGDLNELGQVFGGCAIFDDAGNQRGFRAFVYTDGAGSVEIPAPASWWLGGGGINNRGQVALYGGTWGIDEAYAYRYSPATGFEPLGSFGGARTEAEAINNAGQVTGFSETPEGRNHAFRYTDSLGLENVGTGFTNSRGYAINDRGWVSASGQGQPEGRGRSLTVAARIRRAVSAAQNRPAFVGRVPSRGDSEEFSDRLSG